jgi:hypothetical protein
MVARFSYFGNEMEKKRGAQVRVLSVSYGMNEVQVIDKDLGVGKLWYTKLLPPEASCLIGRNFLELFFEKIVTDSNFKF